MKIRTITLGVSLSDIYTGFQENEVNNFLEISENILSQKTDGVRTKRICLTPLTLEQVQNKKTVNCIERTSDICEKNGIRWFCVPFDLFNYKKANKLSLCILKEFPKTFVNYIITRNKKLLTSAILNASENILNVSKISKNGIDNFRFGTSFNCKPHTPFFPFSYHKGKKGFSVALELVPLFVEICKEHYAKYGIGIRDILIKELSPKLKQIEKRCLKIQDKTSLKYYGLDLSLAPHPETKENSVAYLIELLGVEQFGANGTAFATSFLTNVIKTLIKKTKIKTTGFNGVMYSVLEDPELGRRNRGRSELSMDSLILFSTMCGCGVDMVPLPGKISKRGLASIMLDMAAVSLRLDKPLGVRLLPIPGKNSGELTSFKHDFLYNSKIFKIRNRAFDIKSLVKKDTFGYQIKV